MIAFCAGAGAILTRDEDLEPWLAVPFGVAMGLTLDESALLLELEDVYWSREGLLVMQSARRDGDARSARAGAALPAPRRANRARDAIRGRSRSIRGVTTPAAQTAQASGPDDLIRPMEADLPRPTAPRTTSQVGRRPLRPGLQAHSTGSAGPPPGLQAPGPSAPPPAPFAPVRPQAPGGPEGPPSYGGRCLQAAGSRSLAHRAWAGKPLASWGSRVGAALIDWVVLFIPAVILFFVVVAGAVGISGDDDASTGAAVAAFILFAILISLVWLLYAPLLMMREGEHNGQTWGGSWSASAWCVTTASG